MLNSENGWVYLAITGRKNKESILYNEIILRQIKGNFYSGGTELILCLQKGHESWYRDLVM